MTKQLLLGATAFSLAILVQAAPAMADAISCEFTLACHNSNECTQEPWEQMFVRDGKTFTAEDGGFVQTYEVLHAESNALQLMRYIGPADVDLMVLNGDGSVIYTSIQGQGEISSYSYFGTCNWIG